MTIIPRSLQYEFTFNADSDSTAQWFPAVLPPHLGGDPAPLMGIRGRIRAIKMLFAASQSRTLETVRLRIVKEVGQPNPSSDLYLLYDSGVLDDGVVPTGGTVAISLTGSNSTAFWIDHMGNDGPMYDGQLRLELLTTSTGGSGDDYISLALDLEEWGP